MRGYDLDLELPYWERDGVRYCLGSEGSMILGCPKCGEEHFRESIRHPENCFSCHTRMEPLTFGNRDKYIAIWTARGDHITTVDERKATRLEREAKFATAVNN